MKHSQTNAALLATESHLGREPNGSEISRRPLMDELAARGLRMTAQRRLLISIIQNASRHLDAAALLRLAKEKDPGIDRATIYRTISLLKRSGLIDELDLMHIEGEKHYYEVKTSRDHCHMACFRCGGVMEYTSPTFEKLKAEMSKQSGFQIRVARLELGGVCQKCAQGADRSRTAKAGH